jgi:hypothetical protein
MENETALSIVKTAAERGISLTPLERKIRDEKDQNVRQEWDAAYYDYANDVMYIAEAKHHLTELHVLDIQRRLGLLPGLMKVTKTPRYGQLNPKSIVVVVAMRSFVDKAKQEAVKLGYNLCYPSGDSYGVESLNAISPSGSDSIESVLA